MKNVFFVSAVLVAACTGYANLVVNGDFTTAKENLAPHVRAESGRGSLFTEEYTWNRCGKCEVTEGVPDREKEGAVIHAATAVIGLGAGGKTGFPVEPYFRRNSARIRAATGST